MIHFFEGFKGPLASAVQARDALVLTEFIFGTSSYGQINAPEGGALLLNNPSSGKYRVSSRKGIESANMLVIGYSMEYLDKQSFASGQYGGYAFTPGKYTTVPDTHSGESNSQGLVNQVLEDQLPVLMVSPYNIAGGTATTNKGLSLRTSSGGGGSAATTLWNEELPGVNFYQKHFYEVVYDFVNNKIAVWLDNVLVGTIDYAFTATQKTMRIRLRLDGSSYYFSSGAAYLFPQLNGMYAATERLGPVSWGLSKPTADAEVSAEFTTLPGWSKVNQRQDGNTAARITTTKSKQKALFKGSTVTGDVLAVSVRGRYSSTEQSALEAFGAVKTTIKSNGQEVQQNALAIPKQSFVTPIDLFEKSPFTGVSWTAAELTAMTYGAEIVVTPKVVT